MCLSIPAKVCSVLGQSAIVDCRGIRRTVLLTVNGVEPENWVLIYGGAAIGTLDEDEALETLALIERGEGTRNHSYSKP